MAIDHVLPHSQWRQGCVEKLPLVKQGGKLAEG